ncbi:hypothetical protein OKW43_000879 [Paraburkholderia sp. WC7.3g]
MGVNTLDGNAAAAFHQGECGKMLMSSDCCLTNLTREIAVRVRSGLFSRPAHRRLPARLQFLHGRRESGQCQGRWLLMWVSCVVRSEP